MSLEQYRPVGTLVLLLLSFFVYLRAERHDKVVTIIFYFARAVSHATVRSDRSSVLYLVAAPPGIS